MMLLGSFYSSKGLELNLDRRWLERGWQGPEHLGRLCQARIWPHRRQLGRTGGLRQLPQVQGGCPGNYSGQYGTIAPRIRVFLS